MSFLSLAMPLCHMGFKSDLDIHRKHKLCRYTAVLFAAHTRHPFQWTVDPYSMCLPSHLITDFSSDNCNFSRLTIWGCFAARINSHWREDQGGSRSSSGKESDITSAGEPFELLLPSVKHLEDAA